MKHLYIFDETYSNAAIFGIGKYVKLLLDVLSDVCMDVTVVKLYSTFDHLMIEYIDGVRYIYIPSLTPEYASRTHYYLSASFMLLPYISLTDSNIFHYNYLSLKEMSVVLKHYYPDSHSLLTIHYRDSNRMKDDLNVRKFVNDCCDKIIVLTKKAAISLCEDYDTPRDKIFIVPNYVSDNSIVSSMDKNEIKKILGFNQDKKILLYVGRFDSNKNPYLLLRVFLSLVKNDTSFHLVLIGKGDYDSLFDIIMGNWSSITFTGFLDSNQLKLFYSIADIGIIPSYYEEFGYVALEMLMHGIPVVANRVGGLKEIIEDGISGRLLDLYIDENTENSEVILKNAILEILSDDTKYNYYSINARKRYKDFFCVEKFKIKMLDIYNVF